MQEGVLALYRGWLPSVIGVIPYVGLNFAVYETLKDMAVKHYGVESDRELSSTLRLSAGGVAGTIGQTIAYPFDVVRRRLQVRWPPGLSASHACMITTRHLTCATRTSHLCPRPGAPGGTGGCCLCMHVRCAVVRVRERTASPRVQVSGWDGAKQLHMDDGHAIRYRGMVDCFVRTVREEGTAALFKGIVPNYVKVIPSIAIAFVVYEHVCEALEVEVKISAG